MAAAQVVHVGRQLPVTVAMAAVLERSFPDEYEARQSAGGFRDFWVFGFRVLSRV